jgi:PAS domain-containing protein
MLNADSRISTRPPSRFQAASLRSARVTWKIFLPDGAPLPHDQCPMAAALRGGQVAGGIECIAERPDGSRFWFAPYPSLMRDAAGRITGGINLLVDITERKVAEIEANENFGASAWAAGQRPPFG